MTGSMDANVLAARLLEGLDTLEVGPMLRGELARRLEELGLAAPPPPRGNPLPSRGTWQLKGAFRRAIQTASGGEIRVLPGLVRTKRDPSGVPRLSYGGTGDRRWDEVTGRIGTDVFAKRVLQLLEGEVGEGFEVGFGLGRTDPGTISLRRIVEPTSRSGVDREPDASV